MDGMYDLNVHDDDVGDWWMRKRFSQMKLKTGSSDGHTFMVQNHV